MTKSILFSVLLAAVLTGCVESPRHIFVESQLGKERFSDVHEALKYVREVKALFPNDTLKVFLNLEWHDVSLIRSNFHAAHFKGENFNIIKENYDETMMYIVNQPTLSSLRRKLKVIGEFHF